MPARKVANKIRKVTQRPPKCVQVRFQNGHTGIYSYITYFDFKIGDYAVVNTPRGTFEIVEIHGFCDDFWRTKPYSCKWIVAKLDLEEYKRVRNLPVSELIAATPPKD